MCWINFTNVKALREPVVVDQAKMLITLVESAPLSQHTPRVSDSVEMYSRTWPWWLILQEIIKQSNAEIYQKHSQKQHQKNTTVHIYIYVEQLNKHTNHLQKTESTSMKIHGENVCIKMQRTY